MCVLLIHPSGFIKEPFGINKVKLTSPLKKPNENSTLVTEYKGTV